MVETDPNELSEDFEAAIGRVDAGARITILVEGQASAMLVPFAEPARSHASSGVSV